MSFHMIYRTLRNFLFHPPISTTTTTKTKQPTFQVWVDCIIFALKKCFFLQIHFVFFMPFHMIVANSLWFLLCGKLLNASGGKNLDLRTCLNAAAILLSGLLLHNKNLYFPYAPCVTCLSCLHGLFSLIYFLLFAVAPSASFSLKSWANLSFSELINFKLTVLNV